jgi:uncharacterized protein YbjT (DUF2867 family)
LRNAIPTASGTKDGTKAAGVEHFVYTSVIGAGPDHLVDFFRTKHKVEQYLRDSGLSYTILRPTAFMETHVHDLLGKSILESGKTTIFGRGEKPINFAAGRDVARLAVLALTEPSARGKTIEIGGPDNLSPNQVAELYGRLSGRTPRVSHVPPGVLRFMSALIRPFHPGLSRIMFLSAVDDAVDLSIDPTAALREYPLALTRLEDFVREQVAAGG